MRGRSKVVEVKAGFGGLKLPYAVSIYRCCG